MRSNAHAFQVELIMPREYRDHYLSQQVRPLDQICCARRLYTNRNGTNMFGLTASKCRRYAL
jgi:hypothetical protein